MALTDDEKIEKYLDKINKKINPARMDTWEHKEHGCNIIRFSNEQFQYVFESLYEEFMTRKEMIKELSKMTKMSKKKIMAIKATEYTPEEKDTKWTIQ
jgi:hypothetical protein